MILAVASELAVAGWQEWYSKGRQLAFEGRAAEARPLLLAALRDVAAEHTSPLVKFARRRQPAVTS